MPLSLQNLLKIGQLKEQHRKYLPLANGCFEATNCDRIICGEGHVVTIRECIAPQYQRIRGGELHHTYKRRNVSEGLSIAGYDLGNYRR